MIELLMIALFGGQGLENRPQNTVEMPTIAIIEPAKLPQQINDQTKPALLNDPKLSVLAQDLNSGKILFTKDADKIRNIASLTKIMTFLVIYENHKLDEIVTVEDKATRTIGAQIDLYAYEKLKVSTLLEAILIPSANDAARALAMFDAETEAAFVEKMNKKAKALGLNSARFYNSTGLDLYSGGEDCNEFTGENCEESYGNQMSAEDLMKLTRIALRYNYFREIIQKDHFYGTSIDEEFFHEKPSTNQLILDEDFKNSKGVKTGYTYLAGQCFINLGQNNAGDELLTIVLGSSDRFSESKKILLWILDNFDWR
jgi:D-alanyl-D-alanine carboxypeptidase (penicillin-binding protein 5/6)